MLREPFGVESAIDCTLVGGKLTEAAGRLEVWSGKALAHEVPRHDDSAKAGVGEYPEVGEVPEWEDAGPGGCFEQVPGPARRRAEVRRPRLG